MSNVRNFGPTSCGCNSCAGAGCPECSSCGTRTLSQEEQYQSAVIALLKKIANKDCPGVEVITECLTVLEAGNWGEVGDTIQKLIWFDTSEDNPTPYATQFYNVNSATFVSGVTTENTVPCSGGGGGGGDTITAFEYPICDNGTQKIVHVCINNCSEVSVSFLALDRSVSTEPSDWNVVEYGTCGSGGLPENAATATNQESEIALLEDIKDGVDLLNTNVTKCDTNDVSISNFPPVQPVSFVLVPLDPQAPDSSNITTSSVAIIPANADRAGMVITNISSVMIFLSFGADAAALYSGVGLYPGASFAMDETTFTTEAVNAIGASAASNALSIQEWNNF